MDFKKIKEHLDDCMRPLFFYDDDADGLSSFLMMYRYKGEGKGVIIKTHPKIDKNFLRKVDEYSPDKIFILDIAQVSESFTDKVSVPIIWVDHHDPKIVKKTIYFNPRNDNMILPTSYMIHKALGTDIWLGMAGTVGDWVYIKDIYDNFRKLYPDLLDSDIDKPEEALFRSRIGLISKVFNFVLKGDVKSANQCIKVLTRISEPYEILDQTTPQGKFIWKKYLKINRDYESELGLARKSKGEFIIHKYYENRMSFTSELSNELLYLNPGKIVIVARIKSGQAKMSIRSPKGITLPSLIDKSMAGLKGFGGGHEHACGVVIEEADWDIFINNLKDHLKAKDY